MPTTVSLKRSINWQNLNRYRCHVCSYEQESHIVTNLSNGYRVVKCELCTVTAAQPMPTDVDLLEYYAHYHGAEDTDPALERKLVAMHAGLVDLLRKQTARPGKLRLLDYGFGKGAFLLKALEAGVEAWGVEFSEQTCERVRQICEKRGLSCNLIDLTRGRWEHLPKGSFDCITLFQVIEHVVYPVGLLQKLGTLLRTGGVLYLECPNEDALYLKIKNRLRMKLNRGDFYGSLNPPQHIHGFNRKSMKALISEAGFDLIEVKDYAYADGFHQPETITYYPTLLDYLRHPKLDLYTIGKTVVRVMEPWASRILGAGGGLATLARKSR